MTDWTASPLEVDGSRECVRMVAALPSDWTTDGERLVLLAMACDAFGRESAPGLDNVAAWTGMPRRSVARILERLQQGTDERPALVLKTRKSNGGPRATSRYRLLPAVTEQGPNSDLTVTEQGPTDTDNSDLTVTSTVTVGHPPSPSPDKPSLSPAQRAVVNALGLTDDDERLNSVDKMLKDNGALKPIGWIRSCASNGDLSRLLEDAHDIAKSAQSKTSAMTAEADRTWRYIQEQAGTTEAWELREQVKAELTGSYPQGIPPKILHIEMLRLIEEKAS